MLTKEEIKQALYLNLKNHNWEANSNYKITEQESIIILEMFEKEKSDKFNEIHG